MFLISKTPCGCGGQLYYKSKYFFRCCRCSANTKNIEGTVTNIPIIGIWLVPHQINFWPKNEYCSNTTLLCYTKFSESIYSGAYMYFCPRCQTEKFLTKDGNLNTKVTIHASQFIQALLEG
jgi:hypothetical protein